MKYKIIFVISLALPNYTAAFAQSARTVCPTVLDAAAVSTGFNRVELHELFNAFDNIDSLKILPDSDINTAVIEAGNDTKTFKISIEESNTDAEKPKKKIQFDCPVVKSWKVTALPEVNLVKSDLVKDEITPDFVGKRSYAVRDGVRLVRLFDDSDDYFTINLFWTINSDVNISLALPPVVARSEPKVETPTLLDSNFPVRGVRISSTKKFGNIWYLLTKTTLARISKLEFLPTGFNTNPDDSMTEISKRSATLENLDFYDSLNGTFIPCTQILSKSTDSNCYNFNAQLNPNLWKSIRSGETFFVQLMIPLEKGYLLQTYSVGGTEHTTPVLIEQKFEVDLLKQRIQRSFF